MINYSTNNFNLLKTNIWLLAATVTVAVVCMRLQCLTVQGGYPEASDAQDAQKANWWNRALNDGRVYEETYCLFMTFS